jgi:hypothetical protein
MNKCLKLCVSMHKLQYCELSLHQQQRASPCSKLTSANAVRATASCGTLTVATLPVAQSNTRGLLALHAAPSAIAHRTDPLLHERKARGARGVPGPFLVTVTAFAILLDDDNPRDTLVSSGCGAASRPRTLLARFSPIVIVGVPKVSLRKSLAPNCLMQLTAITCNTD